MYAKRISGMALPALLLLSLAACATPPTPKPEPITLDPGFSRPLFTEGKPPEEYNKQAFALYRLKDYRGALYILEKAQEANPGSMVLALNRSDLLVKAGRPMDGLYVAEQAVKLDPSMYLAWFKKGNAESALRRYRDALDSYDNTLRLRPGYKPAVDYRIAMLRKLGRSEEATEAIDSLLAANNASPMAWYNRACMKAATGDLDGALHDLTMAISLDEDNRKRAADDEDLSALKGMPEFEAMVRPKPRQKTFRK